MCHADRLRSRVETPIFASRATWILCIFAHHEQDHMTSSSADNDAVTLIEDPRIQLPVVAQRNERVARKGFWRKLARVAGKVPFAEDATAAYYCAIDPGTPMRVRATLFAAITYFIVPTDLIPDVIAALGFTDDATVLTTAIAIVGSHIKDHHRIRAQRTLKQGEFEDA